MHNSCCDNETISRIAVQTFQPSCDNRDVSREPHLVDTRIEHSLA